MKPTASDINSFLRKLDTNVQREFNSRAQGMFSFKFSDHFQDRLEQQAAWDDLKTMGQLITQGIRGNLCEMIYWAHLPNRPRRLEFRHGPVVLGLIYSDTFQRFICTTFINNRRSDGDAGPYVIRPLAPDTI